MFLSASVFALFICCFYKDEHAEAQLIRAFPPWLYAHAFDRRYLGGEMRLKKLNLLDRIIVTRLLKIRKDSHLLNYDAIDHLCRNVLLALGER